MLIYISLVWLAGIFLGWPAPWPVWLAGLIISAFLIWWGFNFRRQTSQDTGQTRWSVPTIAIVGLCIIAFLATGFRLQASFPTSDEPSLSVHNDKGTVDIQGLVERDPELKEYGIELRLQVNKIKSGGEWKPVSGVVLLRVERFATYRYGDLLRVQGKLETPPQFPGFNYREYLAHQGVASILRQPKIELVESGQGNWFLERTYSLRQRLAKSLAHSLPEPQASLAQGVLLGLRGNIPQELNNTFVRSGTTHLLAISGQNITIVAGIVLGLAVWALGRRRPTYLILSVAILWLYTFLVGGQPPVIRAAIMASLFLAAEYAGRPGSAPTALALAAAIMAGISPSILGDASFQLSFLSMAGLVYLASHFRALGERVHLPLPIAISLAVSLAAIVATWPIIAYDFGRVSVVGLPATALAAPALPPIIVASALAAVLGQVVAPLGIAMGWVAWLPLTYLMWVAQGFAALPAASASIQSFPLALAAGYYALGIGFLVFTANWQRWQPFLAKSASWFKYQAEVLMERVSWKWATFILAPIAILVWTAGLTMPPGDRLVVSFLNVSDGEAILIQTPSRHYILIDGGANGQSLSLALGKKLPFWQRKLDLVVLTTPRVEHVGGLVEALERYGVGGVWEVGVLSPQRPPREYAQWQWLLAEKGIQAIHAEQGLKLREGDSIVLEALYPPNSPMGSDRQNKDNTVVLRLKIGEVSFLFTSDIGGEVERQLMAERANLESTVLKVANHGSAGSTSAGFLARVNPAAAVVMVGAKDRLGRPAPEVMDRLKQRVGADRVFVTGEHGTIDFITDGRRLWVKTEK